MKNNFILEHSKTFRKMLMMGSLFGCLALTACSSDAAARKEPDHAPAPAPAPASVPGNIATKSDAPAQEIASVVLLNLKPRQENFVTTIGNPVGQAKIFRITAATADNWDLTIPDDSITHLRLTAQGEGLVSSEEDFEENVIVTYEPPLRLFPAKLTLGQPQTQSVKMTVLNRKTHKVRDEGSCDISVLLLAHKTVTTPAGDLDAFVIQTTRSIRLHLANSTVISHTAFAPGRGMIAEKIEENTRAIGLFNMAKTNEMRLAR